MSEPPLMYRATRRPTAADSTYPSTPVIWPAKKTRSSRFVRNVFVRCFGPLMNVFRCIDPKRANCAFSRPGIIWMTRFCSGTFIFVWKPTRLKYSSERSSFRSCTTAYGRSPVTGCSRPTGFIGPKRSVSGPRVAIGRALAIDTQIILMDEPFGALDEQTRLLMGEWLLEIWRRKRKTVGFVTHSLHEALALSTRVVVMTARPGRIKSVLELPMPYPRVMESAEMTGLRARLWAEIRDESLRAMGER